MKKDKEAFTEILEDHKLILFKVCNSYCRDSEDRKDLVQEMILQLWKSFGTYDPQYKLSTWMYRIALNVAISYYRKSTTRQKHIAPFEGDFVHIAEEEEEDINDELNRLQHFISQLNEMNRALMLLYLDGKSHDEIANILNISKSNVGTKITRIKAKLKKQMV